MNISKASVQNKNVYVSIKYNFRSVVTVKRELKLKLLKWVNKSSILIHCI